MSPIPTQPAFRSGATTGERSPLDGRRTTRLSDVVDPLAVDEFVDQHWLPGVPHLGRVGSEVTAALTGVDGLAGPEALMERHRRDVRLLGPRGERRSVPADEALTWLERGHTLYVDYLHRTVPEAHELMHGLAADMGFEPWQLTMEAFAGVAGSVSTRHYDHDVTIQFLLSGDKAWTLEPNDSIVNPLQPFHPPVATDDPLAAFGEEVHAADDPQLARRAAPGTHLTFDARAGSSVFVPRGWWHATRARTDTWSVNVVFHSISWARGLGRALEMRLHADPRFRAYCGGPDSPARGRTGTEERQRDDTMADLRAAALHALAEITPDELPLAMLGFVGRLFHWSPSVGRRVALRDERWTLVVHRDGDHVDVPVPDSLAPAVDRLCRLTSTFRWDHLPPLVGDGDAGDMHRLLTELVELGAVEVVHAGLGA